MNRYTLLIISLLAVTPFSYGHHSETAEFDRDNPVSISGTITAVEWNNPHVWFYVDVTEDNGEITTWGFSLAPPGSLMRRGIYKSALEIGAFIDVSGSRARDGSNNASGRRVTFPDGTNVLTSTEGN